MRVAELWLPSVGHVPGLVVQHRAQTLLTPQQTLLVPEYVGILGG